MQLRTLPMFRANMTKMVINLITWCLLSIKQTLKYGKDENSWQFECIFVIYLFPLHIQHICCAAIIFIRIQFSLFNFYFYSQGRFYWILYWCWIVTFKQTNKMWEKIWKPFDLFLFSWLKHWRFIHFSRSFIYSQSNGIRSLSRWWWKFSKR